MGKKRKKEIGKIKIRTIIIWQKEDNETKESNKTKQNKKNKKLMSKQFFKSSKKNGEITKMVIIITITKSLS